MIKGRAFMVYWSFDHKPTPQDAPFFEQMKQLGIVVLHFSVRHAMGPLVLHRRQQVPLHSGP